MGCCLGVLLLAGAPRLALVVWWFTDPSRVLGTFAGWAANLGGWVTPGWIWPLAGLLLLPWTTVAFVFVSPGGVVGWEWAVIAFGLLLDLSTHGGSQQAYRRRRSSER
jgi:hypothetical protein